MAQQGLGPVKSRAAEVRPAAVEPAEAEAERHREEERQHGTWGQPGVERPLGEA